MRLFAASSPHIKSSDDIRTIMGDTILPLLFLLVAAVCYTGIRALTITAISVLSCIIFEYLYRRFMRKNRMIGDFSAIITGMIIAFCVPVSTPISLLIVGDFFAIVVVKQLFGGLGRNVFNPAAAAICFLTVNWPGIMSTFPLPTAKFDAFATPSGFQTGVTSLTSLKSGALPNNNLSEIFIGYTPGNLGNSMILIIAVAAVILLFRRIINWRIPVSFLGTIAVLAFAFPRCPSGRLDSVFYELMSGSVIFIAVFVATDPVTSPVSRLGRVFYGITCGIVTVFMRYFGIYPEGAFFAILLVNPFVLAFDRLGWKISTKGGRLLYEEE